MRALSSKIRHTVFITVTKVNFQILIGRGNIVIYVKYKSYAFRSINLNPLFFNSYIMLVGFYKNYVTIVIVIALMFRD